VCIKQCEFLERVAKGCVADYFHTMNKYRFSRKVGRGAEAQR